MARTRVVSRIAHDLCQSAPRRALGAAWWDSIGDDFARVKLVGDTAQADSKQLVVPADEDIDLGRQRGFGARLEDAFKGGGSQDAVDARYERQAIGKVAARVAPFCWVLLASWASLKKSIRINALLLDLPDKHLHIKWLARIIQLASNIRVFLRRFNLGL